MILHVGEVVLPYNPITHEVRIHHYVDLGVSGKHWDVTKELNDLHLYSFSRNTWTTVQASANSPTIGRSPERRNTTNQLNPSFN